MLVQLSPWETTRTSIRFPVSSSSPRRRKRESTDANDDGGMANEYPTVAASCITTATRRSLARMRNHSSEFSDCLPVLALTSEHHISVIGKQLDEKSPSFREYTSLHYSSRPGGAGSFFAKPKNGKIHACDLPRIPAVADTKNDWVYAFQHGNNRLCCWHLWKGSGPDEKTTLKAELRSPALSMMLLPMNKGIVYGSCQNGDIYVARAITTEAETCLAVEYLPSRQPKGSVHIGTLAEIQVDQPKASGRKRKMSDADGNSSVLFHQVFCDGLSVRIVRHSVLFSLANASVLIRNESLLQNTMTLDLPSIPSGTSSRHQLTRAELLVSSSGSAPKVSFVYTVRTIAAEMTKKTGQNHQQIDSRLETFCVTLSLATANISHSPVRLSPRANQFGLVSETVLVAASDDTIHLYDLMNGTEIYRRTLKRIIPDMDGDWLLHTDAKFSFIAVLYSKDCNLHVCFSSVTKDRSKAGQGATKLKSSETLIGSLLVSAKATDTPVTQNIGVSTCLLLDAGLDDEAHVDSRFVFTRLDDSVTKALRMLDEARKSHGNSENSFKGSFSEVFDGCISSLTEGINHPNTDSKDDKELPQENEDVTPHNPQDPSSLEHNEPRKTLQSPKSVITKLNGGKSRNTKKNWLKKIEDISSHNKNNEDIPSHIPQQFIEGAVIITMNAIQAEKKAEPSSKALTSFGLEARMVLRRLLRSKRVSARRHFEGSYPLMEIERKHPLAAFLQKMDKETGKNPLSAMQLIVELLENCSDLSERQLVILIDYMMRFPQADVIAETFAQSRVIRKKHLLKSESEKFLSCRNKRVKHADTNQPTRELDESPAAEEQKLIVSAVETVLQMIVCYSECNEVMLRVALVEGLSSVTEAVLLARMLSTMLTPRSSILYRNQRHIKSVRGACQWIAALSEAFKDDLKKVKTPSGVDYVTFLVNSLKKASENSLAIMSFKDDIGIAEMTKKNLEKEAKIHAHRQSKDDDLPGYSIEHFIF